MHSFINGGICMKKLFIALLAILCVISFISCDPSAGKLDGAPNWLAGKQWKGDCTNTINGNVIATEPITIYFEKGQLPNLDEMPSGLSVSAIATNSSYTIKAKGTVTEYVPEINTSVKADVNITVSFKKIYDNLCDYEMITITSYPGVEGNITIKQTARLMSN